jgi:hypothetical protein
MDEIGKYRYDQVKMHPYAVCLAYYGMSDGQSALTEGSILTGDRRIFAPSGSTVCGAKGAAVVLVKTAHWTSEGVIAS